MREVITFNDNWTFNMPGAEPVIVTVPHTWNGKDGQDGGNDYKRLQCTYTKTFKAPAIPDGGKCLIVFNGVNSESEVIVNGTSICSHLGGYSRFAADITAVLKDENVVEVKVSNQKNPAVYPQRADFTFYGGIYRDVTLEVLPASRFVYGEHCAPALKCTPAVDGANGKLSVSATLEGEGEVKISVLDADGSTVACGGVGELVIENVHLWNGVKDPYLYTVKAELVVGGKVEDEVESKIGFRTFKVDPKKGFFLNGKKYPLRGVCRHQDRPDLGNALTTREHDEDMALIREMGANTIRLAHYQHDQYFYDLCDKFGLVVWAEIPYISKHEKVGNANTEFQMRELIAQNYNHASICFWGISNEITMMRNYKKDMIQNHINLNKLCHELDKTRLTTLACFALCGFNNKTAHITDVVSWNLYFGWYIPCKGLYKLWYGCFRLLHKNRPVGLSEYGAECMPNLHSLKPKRCDNTEEYQASYHEYCAKFITERDYLWATHVWNMFDFAADGRNQGGDPGKNHKGLVTFDRKTRKDAFYIYKAYWTDEPFVHICSKRFVNRTGKKIKVKVYSNLPEIALYNNGVLMSKKSGNKVFEFTIPMQAKNELVAKCGEYEDSATVIHVAKKDPAYMEKNLGSALSWEK